MEENIAPMWVELLGMLIFVFMIFGLPFGYIVKRDYNKIGGYAIMGISICCWIFVGYKIIIS